MDTSDLHVLEEKLPIFRQSLPSTYYVVHLAASLGDIDVADDNACHGLQYLPKLIEFSKAFCAAVHREEAMRILKIRLLQKLSRYTGISKLMVPCNSDELAELTIAQLCLGRGGNISKMTDVVEKTLGGTVFIRPLRDISSAEIEVALRLENMEHCVFLSEKEKRQQRGLYSGCLRTFWLVWEKKVSREPFLLSLGYRERYMR
ncbi:hypothetical protein RB195_022432 [Necator americanus]|uniref:Uncharacterized protein n=1 Tax=Necator americanus TaxID=51031 RepID=A0ABR1EHV3_NECAM